jgi:hypothetical protein
LEIYKKKEIARALQTVETRAKPADFTIGTIKADAITQIPAAGHRNKVEVG